MAFVMVIMMMPAAISETGMRAVERIDLNIDAITIGVGQKVKTVKPAATPSAIQWTLDGNGTLTISGSGPMDDFGEYLDLPPWSARKGEIKSVVIKAGVTSIGDFAFYKCTNLASVTIPDSISPSAVTRLPTRAV